MSQNATSVITRVKPAEVGALQELLDSIGSDVSGNPTLQFSSVKTTHFASFVLLDRDTDAQSFPPTLVFEGNHDGTQDAFLDDLTRNAAACLHAIYSKCEGYPAGDTVDTLALKQYLQKSSVATPAFYIGCYGQSLDSINNATNTRLAIEGFLDAEQAKGTLEGQSQRDTFGRIQTFLQQNPVTPAYTPTETRQSILQRSNTNLWAWILIAAAVVLALLPFVLIALAIFVILLRSHETSDADTPTMALPVDPRLFGKEDIFTQNHLTTQVMVKPGPFRLGVLKVVLALINALAKTVFIAGSLGGIPTIHFARWLLMDNDRRLLFFSNYDGSWASYLGDFVDKANYGLTAVWSNTANFPPSKFLFFGGALHIEAFKAWSRQHNEYASVWYSAYPDQTVSNITDSIVIRDGLTGPMNDAQLARWFKLL